MLALLVLIVGTLAFSQADQLLHVTVPTPNSHQPVAVSAASIVRDTPYPSVIHLKGSVEVKMPICVQRQGSGMDCEGYMILHADEADFHEDTGRVDARGNVSITPVRP
jgi:hypothetical protein